MMNRQLELEFWAEIPDYEGFYEESSLGRTRNIRTGRILKPGNVNGYMQVALYKNKVKKEFLVHRLVWTAFVEDIPEGYEIDHLSTERSDNRLSNLRCVTCKENNNNPITKIKQYNGVRKACNKSVVQLDKTTGELIKRWECAMDAHRELGVDFRPISECCRGKRKSAGGYKWCFFMPPALIYPTLVMPSPVD